MLPIEFYDLETLIEETLESNTEFFETNYPRSPRGIIFD
jgi:hypothetical protein